MSAGFSIFLAALTFAVDGPNDNGHITCEVNPSGQARFFDDEDIELQAEIVTVQGNTVATIPLTDAPNRGDTGSRYFKGLADLSAAGLNLAAGKYALRIVPSASQWTETSPTTGDTSNTTTADVSMVECDIVLEAAGALVTRQWRA